MCRTKHSTNEVGNWAVHNVSQSDGIHHITPVNAQSEFHTGLREVERTRELAPKIDFPSCDMAKISPVCTYIAQLCPLCMYSESELLLGQSCSGCPQESVACYTAGSDYTPHLLTCTIIVLGRIDVCESMRLQTINAVFGCTFCIVHIYPVPILPNSYFHP